MKFRFRPPHVTTPPSRVVHELAKAETDAKAEVEAEGEIEVVAEIEVDAEAEGKTEGEADAESVAAPPVVVYEDIPNAELLVGVLRLAPSPLQFTTPPKSVVQVLKGAATEALTIAPVVTVVVKAMYTVVAPPAAGVAVDTDARIVVLKELLPPKLPAVPEMLALAVAPSPRPAEGLAPRLIPEEPVLAPTPREAANDADTSTVADLVRPTMVLEEAPLSPTPPLAPELGLGVTVATTQPFKMLPPLLQVFVPDVTAPEGLKVFAVEPLSGAETLGPSGSDGVGIARLT
ncbi:hypothetical protein LTS09_000841 [Friedmanniomyces endolithicus]|nr:hypothetical protein LTS09_000841 [Friedmanniomyces endolithicus]